MEKFFFLWAMFVEIVVSADTTVALNCQDDENRYIDMNGNCKLCETCPIGHQPEGRCGFGDRKPGYKCVECPKGTFSLFDDYHSCRTCQQCDEWKSSYLRSCSPVQDSICGPCNEGYYRYKKSTGVDEQCIPCDDHAPKGTKQCTMEFPWKAVAITLAVVLSVIIIVFVTYCVYTHKKRNRSRYKSKASERFIEITPASSTIDASQSLGDSTSESSLMIEPPKPSYPLVTSHVTEIDFEGKGDNTALHCHPISHIERYSDMPTARFHEDPPINRQHSASHIPLRTYDEACGRHNATAPVVNHMRSAIRDYSHQNELTISNENLLQNMNKLNDGRSSDATFEPESFDTRSYSSEVSLIRKARNNS